MPETSLDGAREIAERIRLMVENFDLPIGPEKSGGITVSLGVAQFNIDTEDINALIKRADNALYIAKGRGRNRVYIIDE